MVNSKQLDYYLLPCFLPDRRVPAARRRTWRGAATCHPCQPGALRPIPVACIPPLCSPCVVTGPSGLLPTTMASSLPLWLAPCSFPGAEAEAEAATEADRCTTARLRHRLHRAHHTLTPWQVACSSLSDRHACCGAIDGGTAAFRAGYACVPAATLFQNGNRCETTTTHFLLLTAYCSLLIAHCLLLTAHCLQPSC